MASLQIGKYKRPGIFIEEYDISVIASQTVQGIVNTVIGVSKTGPVNTPILITNTTDLQNIFGTIDRNLERKGSFFHRTIAQMIQSSPVYAINLLATDDTLDKIEYKSLSVTTDKTNDVVKTGAYRRFFNNTGFWKTDADSFLTLVSTNPNYEDRVLNLTNMSSNYITAFVFKSTITGYDVSMINWYGSVELIPTYVYPTDFVSDYMVDVVVVAGDWSNYQALSVDPKWTKYFDSTGLIKTQVSNFTNDANVTLLKYYQGLSLIPYFKDINNQNVFIETVINKDTTKTGLFCAFNIDLFETDFPNGKIDLIGNNLVTDNSLIDSGITDVEFLSYKDTITESVTYMDTKLDTPANVIGLDGSGTFRSTDILNTDRTDWYSEDIVTGIFRKNGTTFDSASASVAYNWNSFAFNGTDTTPYTIIGGNKVLVAATASFKINAGDYGSFSTTKNYYAAFKLDTTGTITAVTTPATDTYPAVDATDIVLGYMSLTTQNGGMLSMTFSDVNVATASYIDLAYGSDYTITSLGVNNTFKVEFLSTAAVPSASNYAQYRKIKRFNSYRNILESVNVNESVIMMDFGSGYIKVSLNGMSVGPIVTSTTANKSFTIQTNLGLSETAFNVAVTSMQTAFVMYSLDNEQIFSDCKMITTGALPSNPLAGSASYGIVAKYSEIYKNFYSGIINTGDYFYGNVNPYTLTSLSFAEVSGTSYIVLSGTSSGTQFDKETYNTISVPDSILNKGAHVIKNTTNVANSVFGLDNTFNYAYAIEGSVTAETLYSVSTIYNAATKYYLSMFIDGSNNLSVKITDSSLSTWAGNPAIILDYNQTIKVNSGKSNYQESVEIVIPANYTQVANKVLVLGSRYANVKVGDYLEAYVDESLLVAGQVPKRLARIITKRVYSGDTTLVELTCDTRIATSLIGGDYQTMRYSSLDNYVTTYKAITMKGFRIREASLPDGTEARQSSILNLVAKGTPLFRSITNKEALDFRYLIDSFGLGLTELSKQQLVDICGERLDCLGFLNIPSMKSFRKSSSPSFVDAEGVLQTSFIAQGGDLDSNPSFLYSFGEGRGTSAVGYFMPYMVADDNGRPIDVPPAMYVATTFMRKHNSNVSSIVPWTIAAGITDGRITNIAGVEMDFDSQDIINLNGAMMNPIVIKKNRGWCIETENTAQVLYKSALSFLHVREVLIELERELAAMLLQFQWKFNTPDVRAEIKLRADVICAGYVARNGLYNYFNKCDAENNTTTLIDNQIGVLDTYVEPIKGMAMIVNNVSVLKTGAIASGGFITATGV